jgi:hypothetical protein
MKNLTATYSKNEIVQVKTAFSHGHHFAGYQFFRQPTEFTVTINIVTHSDFPAMIIIFMV